MNCGIITIHYIKFLEIRRKLIMINIGRYMICILIISGKLKTCLNVPRVQGKRMFILKKVTCMTCRRQIK